MKVHSSTREDEQIVVVEGAVGAGEVPELLAQLLRAVQDDGGRDVLLDVRGVPSFVDEALAALTAGRSRAKSLRHRIVVLDERDGATSKSLRRSGQIFRFPVYPDVGTASAALAADRASLAATNSLSSSAGPGATPVRALHGREEPR